jgi:preprotein translocase subunit SecD
MDVKQQSIISIIVVVILVAVAWALLWPLNKSIRQGLDIRGGVSVIMTAQPKPGQPAITEDAMSRSEIVLRTRVNQLGVSEASVQRQGSTQLLVQLPGVSDAQSALKAIGSTGLLEFVAADSIQTTATEIKDGLRLTPGKYKAFLTGATITKASVGANSKSGAAVVNLTFDAQGTKIWADYTARNVGKQVAIALDGVVVSAPVIQEAIPTGDTEISGNFTAASAKNLAAILQSGSLPINLVYSEARVVGPTLGQDALKAGLLAVIVGFLLVMAYLGLFYGGLGVTTWLALAAHGSLFLGVLAILSRIGQFALTLPGLAGIVLTIGLAADSSILMVERLKEEVRMGKTYRSAAKSSTRHAFGTSMDADLVTFVSAIALFSFAIGPVRGFALTLMIGIVIDLLVAWFFKRSVIILLADSWIPKAPRLFGLRGGVADE